MAISSVIQTGAQGVQQAMAGMQRSAGKIASAGFASTPPEPPGGVDIVSPLIDMKVCEISAKANAAVVGAGEKMLGTLLDVKV
ncbi:MAG: flagellar biosynthesis protein FlgE [Proteobacteria bacterium]|nr:MAG: flagellar biosynthesis protein FlgE [Pseudomonadota bacterium]